MSINNASPYVGRKDRVVQEVDVRPGAAAGPTADVVVAIPAGANAGAAPVALLTNAAGTGPGTSALDGGRYIWAAAGTFGGASVQLQNLGPDGVTWLDVTGAVLTAAGQAAVDVGAGESLRAKVAGGTPSGLFSTLAKVR